MARIAQKKNENRKVRSFNVDETNFSELKRVAQIEELSMSDILNRVLWHHFVDAKVKKDIEKGIQTTLAIHTHDQRHRDARKDGKCNPASKLGKCATCWGGLE